MDLSWCPGCDCQVFALENLYCSEACKRKDELSSSHIKISYYYSSLSTLRNPRGSFSPSITPINSPKLNPLRIPFSSSPTPSSETFSTTKTTTTMSNLIYLNNCSYLSEKNNYQENNNKLNSSPSELLTFDFS